MDRLLEQSRMRVKAGKDVGAHDVCVAEGSCHSTASTCPLVQGIGKHTSNMGRLALVPCCGREWYLSTVVSFLRYAIRPAPTDDELAKFGLAYDPHRPYH